MNSLSALIIDKTGVIASVGCAIHCMVAPVVLIMAPAIGGIWVNPITHILIAFLVLPVATFALRRGFRTHRSRSILLAGIAGMALVAAGTVAPYFAGEAQAATSADAGEIPVDECEHCQNCCPNLVTEEDGTSRLKIPLASILTMLGGIALVSAHIGNLRCCALGPCG